MKLHPRGAVFVCEHVAELGYPVLRAKRDEPISDEDTGWQFLCNRHKPEKRPLIWALEEIIAHDASLEEYVDCPAGTEISRLEKNSVWQVIGC